MGRPYRTALGGYVYQGHAKQLLIKGPDTFSSSEIVSQAPPPALFLTPTLVM
jgi:hypothetical protein